MTSSETNADTNVGRHRDDEDDSLVPAVVEPAERVPDDAVETYRYTHVVLLLRADTQPAGPDTAAVTAALNAGYRPVGEAVIEDTSPHPDGVSTVVTWAVPVVPVDRIEV